MAAENGDMKSGKIKIQSYTELLLGLAILVLLNVAASFVVIRFDLTKEKRYTLSQASKNLATKLDDVMYVKVYLDGEFPAGFRRLRNATREMLDEFRVYSGNKLEYEFVDPFEGKNNQQINDIIQQLGSQGLYPTNVQVEEDDESSQKIIVPAAMFHYKGKEYPLNLLKNQFGSGAEETINKSIELLEYGIANVLRKSALEKRRKLAFMTGHGELGQYEIGDLARELSDFYEIARLDLNNYPLEKLMEFDGLIIARPTETFDNYEKFKLDQYFMHGGKIIWLIDPLIAHMDSTRNEGGMFMTANYNLNLDDMLFRYGVRINPDLVQDLQCNMIPIMSNYRGGAPQSKLLPWIFFPVMSGDNSHPVTKNLDYVWSQFSSSIDTVGSKKIKKTVLLHSSQYSRQVSNPVQVDINMARVNPDPSGFRKANIPTAVLLEGYFESLFKRRYKGNNDSALEQLQYRESIADGKMIVIADGDIARNQVSKGGEIYPLGYDKYSRQSFGNKNFMVNCVDYLCDDSGIIEVRTREIKLRLLDRARLKSEKLKWQLLNMVLPVLLIILFGTLHAYLRKKKYTA